MRISAADIAADTKNRVEWRQCRVTKRLCEDREWTRPDDRQQEQTNECERIEQEETHADPDKHDSLSTAVVSISATV